VRLVNSEAVKNRDAVGTRLFEDAEEHLSTLEDIGTLEVDGLKVSCNVSRFSNCDSSE